DRLETVADLEAQLPVLGEDHEEHAVVEPLLAEPPLLEEPVGDVLEALALERAEDRDRHLGTRGALVSGELRLEPRALGSREQPRVIVHAGAGAGGSARATARSAGSSRLELHLGRGRRVPRGLEEGLGLVTSAGRADGAGEE